MPRSTAPWFSMSGIASKWVGPAALAVAILILAACGASPATTPPTSKSGAPSPTPGPTSAPSAGPTPSLSSARTLTVVPFPAALQHTWIAPPRAITGVTSGAELPLLYTSSATIELNTNQGSANIFLSSPTVASSGSSLALTLDSAAGGCSVGQTGTYTWSLSADGVHLTLTASQDACPARAAAFNGTWTRSVCRDPNDTCLGTVPAGSYASTFLDLRDASANVPTWGAYGQLHYTVPAGWANSEDYPDNYTLMPAADYAGAPGAPNSTISYGIYLFPRPAAQADNASCANALAPGVAQTPAALAAWVASRPGVIATKPTAITIGGDSGFMLDVRLAPTRTKKCAGDSFPSQLLLVEASAGPDSWNWAIGGTEQMRIILLAIGGGKTVAIFVDDSSSPSRFTDLVAQAMPVIDTFKFPR